MTGSGRNLVWELCSKMTAQRLGPKTIVDYTREAFVFAPGNVRVTLDYGIRTGGLYGLFGPLLCHVPIRDAPSSWRSSGTPSSRRHPGGRAAGKPPRRCLLKIRGLPEVRVRQPFFFFE